MRLEGLGEDISDGDIVVHHEHGDRCEAMPHGSSLTGEALFEGVGDRDDDVDHAIQLTEDDVDDVRRTHSCFERLLVGGRQHPRDALERRGVSSKRSSPTI